MPLYVKRDSVVRTSAHSCPSGAHLAKSNLFLPTSPVNTSSPSISVAAISASPWPIGREPFAPNGTLPQNARPPRQWSWLKSVKVLKNYCNKRPSPAHLWSPSPLGAPGVTNRDDGIVFATSYLKGWRDVPLARLLQSELRLPAVVENDVKLAAVGERWLGTGHPGMDNFVFLAIGTGIAAGIFVNGQLVHGPEWIAGEVGYMIVPGTPEAPAKKGTAGSLKASSAAKAFGGAGCAPQGMSVRRKPSSSPATAIFEQAFTGNRRAAQTLERTARISRLRHLQHSYCPELSVVCFGWRRGHQRAVARRDSRDPRIVHPNRLAQS